ncbi:MAG: creatininase [Armatimonadota bacterium]|nr:creatininase [Armatimonadota bacterium]
MSARESDLSRIAWPEFADRIARDIVAVPVGSIEQHGPHLPLGVDAFIPSHLALRLAARLPMLVAPPLWYAGPSDPVSGGGQRFPGTLAVRGVTLIALAQDVLEEFFRHGARRIALLNGHFENTAFLAEAARRVLAPTDTSGRKAVILNWWEHVPDSALHRLFPEGFPGWEVEHASLTETSLMQAMAPDLVHPERLPRDSAPGQPAPRHKVFPEPVGLVPPSGILYTARGASAERGEALVAVILDALEGILRAEFAPLA